jgi:hypothetical protein
MLIMNDIQYVSHSLLPQSASLFSDNAPHAQLVSSVCNSAQSLVVKRRGVSWLITDGNLLMLAKKFEKTVTVTRNRKINHNKYLSENRKPLS